jgi:hypothetical protein
MFAATPRLRDRLDLRKVLLIALIATGAFGLQVAFLAGMVASPLGGAIADLGRIPQAQGAPSEALAETDPLPRLPADTRLVRRPSARPAGAMDTRHRALPPECVAHRTDPD